MFEIFAAIAAIAGVIGTSESMQAASAGKKAQHAQQEQQNMRFAMERRDTVRQMRMAQASAMARAENQGVGESSGAYGGQGSILSQGAANIKFLDGSKGWADRAGAFMDNAASHQANAAGWGALSSLAQMGMSFSPTPDWLKPAKEQASIPVTSTNLSNAGKSTIGRPRPVGGFGRFGF